MENFQQGFTEQQKAVIISCFITISTRDKGANDAEKLYIEQNASVLGTTISAVSLFAISQGSRPDLSQILGMLSQDNKEWFAHTIHNLLSKGEQHEDQKFQTAMTILSFAGIYQNDFVKIIRKFQSSQN